MTDEQSVLLEKKKVLAMSSPVNATQYQQTDSKLPTIINFWASWCKPCRDELPFLQSISKEKIANVILINVGDSNQIASNMLTELNVNSVKTRAADDEILSRLKFHGLPITLVYKDNQDRFIGAGKLKKQKQISDWLTCKN
ncbi:MAG: TlpA family protein disulfide reductase [Gammaproteobacteria bacterium]|nr:TlpA family protein disulfide reductase [Gammaproteobacteria bacterium]